MISSDAIPASVSPERALVLSLKAEGKLPENAFRFITTDPEIRRDYDRAKLLSEFAAIYGDTVPGLSEARAATEAAPVVETETAPGSDLPFGAGPDYGYHLREIEGALAGGQHGVAAKHAAELLKALRPSGPVGGKSLTHFSEQTVDEGKTLLGGRYLCKEGGLLFVGPSGIGKSTAAVQQDILWALGRPAFGIWPARALRMVCIQAENDDGDLIEFARGIMEGMELSAKEREAVRANTVYVSHKTSTGSEFVQFMARCMEQHKPDIIRIDPLQAYLGDDPKESKALTGFVRNLINPLLEEFQCAVILNHHTPKTNHRDTSAWKSSDWMYAGAGAADLTNWARAVLIIDPCEGDSHLFRFIAAKRGGRIGWKGQDGAPVTERYFRHSRTPGAILWEDADAESVATFGRKPPKTKDDILALVPADCSIEKAALVSKAQSDGIGEKKARHFIAELVHDQRLFVHCTKRKGTNPLQSLARHPQFSPSESTGNGDGA